MTTPDQTDRVLRALRKDVAALENRLLRAETEWRRGAAVSGLAGGMLALLAAPWVSLEDGDQPRHLFQLVEDNPFTLACLGLVLALGLLSFNLTDSRLFHGIVAGIGGAAELSLLFAGAGADSEYTAAVGRWLMFFAVAGLIGLHATWAGDKRY
ncbi:MAG TPA: hypothetical protein VFV67_15760 [Actinophytocola sp.]|uniref:hypothetical protein n=1 Tax=Actinophytocola sp. TaxID=1872138 RepID=UPI002DB707C3|nr:hypothetical protein [Actinophytocola sp.]HEU5472108.1 hypothetical protein [Actinophytocola sp.]